MKRVLCLVFAAVLCFMLACPAFAAEGTFVPSIGYKDSLDIKDAKLDGNSVKDCLTVTSVIEAKDKSTDISQEERDALLEVYQQLLDGTMKSPVEDGDLVIRDLVYVGFSQSDCVGEGHTHQEDLKKEGTTVTVTFDAGIPAGSEVKVLCYANGKWVEAVKTTNNGDGTVTAELEDLGILAFVVDRDAGTPPQTGDAMGRNLLLWILLMLVSLAAVVVLVAGRRRLAQR